MSKKIDNQMLMAYVDAELDEADRKDVERLLADDQEARDTVERYRLTRSAIDQFAGILDEPVPDHLIETVRQHERQTNVVSLPEQTNTGHLWMAIAASLLVGVGLGAITTNYLLVRPSEDETSSAVSRVAELSSALAAMKVEKEAAEKNVEVAENKAAEAVKETAETNQKVAAAKGVAAVAKSTLDDMAKALETAQVETAKAQEQVLAAQSEKPKELLAEGIENIFPFSLVSEAIDNGSKLSADVQETILSELNKDDAPISTASSFSKLIKKSSDEGLTTGASRYETLSDLQPTAKEITPEKPLEQPKKVKAILGEFTYSGKTCRLFEYEIAGRTEASALVACRGGSGLWNIIKGR